jgi:hypothetical protein
MCKLDHTVFLLLYIILFQNYQHNSWLVHLTAKLLVNDPGATSLIAHNPFENGPPPRFVLYVCACARALHVVARA